MSEVTTTALRDYLKTILRAYPALSALKNRWEDAEPSVYPASPFGWVAALGGPKDSGVVGARKTVDNFEVVVVVKSGNWNTAENTALTLKEAVERCVEANPTLNNQVSNAYASNRERQQFNQGKESFSGWRITVTTWRFS